MNIIRYKWIWITLSALLIMASLVVLVVRGLNLGIEFTGGSVVEVTYENAPPIEQVEQTLDGFDFNASVRPFGEDGYIIRTRQLSSEDKNMLLSALEIDGSSPNLERFNSIGPSIGKEMKSKAVIAIIAVVIAIILYIAFAFRKVSKPVSAWKYGLIAIFALVHDVIIPVGVFSLLGFEVNSLFVVGLLSVLGLSVNDTIVVFDRIRERLEENNEYERNEAFYETVGRALRSTIGRSINTSLTLILVLVSLYAFGPMATKELSLFLLIGTILGTYSSIFLASPLLVVWNKRKTSTNSSNS